MLSTRKITVLPYFSIRTLEKNQNPNIRVNNPNLELMITLSTEFSGHLLIYVSITSFKAFYLIWIVKLTIISVLRLSKTQMMCFILADENKSDDSEICFNIYLHFELYCVVSSLQSSWLKTDWKSKWSDFFLIDARVSKVYFLLGHELKQVILSSSDHHSESIIQETLH